MKRIAIAATSLAVLATLALPVSADHKSRLHMARLHALRHRTSGYYTYPSRRPTMNFGGFSIHFGTSRPLASRPLAWQPRTSYVGAPVVNPTIPPPVPANPAPLPAPYVDPGVADPVIGPPVVTGRHCQIGEFVTHPVPLFDCVRVEDRDNVHPAALPAVIAVRDPRLPSHLPASLAPPVFVEICVPPCECNRVRISRNGSRIDLDYGEYEIQITSSRGRVSIDYDD